MQILSALPLGDNSQSTMYLFLGIAAVSAIALLALIFVPMFSKKKEEPAEECVEEVKEETNKE